MIINQDSTSTSIVGDITKHNITISKDDINYISMLLSSNLYSKPKSSFLREIISNAWDSHIEANNIEMPIIVQVTQNSISIRDFGTGLSPEKFEEIYLKIGKSTRRHSNQYIGNFGFGRFSSLSCSNNVTIISYYNGMMYEYLMVKDGMDISVYLIQEKTTEEHNGLTVSLNNINAYEYLEYLELLIFFPNIYVDYKDINFGKFFGKTYFSNINENKTKKYKYFAATYKKLNICSTPQENGVCKRYVLLGNILYNLDLHEIENDIKDEDKMKFRFFRDSSYFLKFDVGELDITPNREELLYSKKTKETIIKRIDEAFKELCLCYKDYIIQDYDSLYEFCFRYDKLNLYSLFDKKPVSIFESVFYRVGDLNLYLVESICKFCDTYPKYKGNQFDIKAVVNSTSFTFLENTPVLNTSYVYTDRYMKVTSKNFATMPRYKCIIIKNTKTISAVIKNYLREKYVNEFVLLYEHAPFSTYYETYKYKLSDYPFITKNQKYAKLIMKGMYDEMCKNTVYFDPKTDADFIFYKKKNEKIVKEKRNENIEITLYQFCRRKEEKTFPSVEKLKEWINGLKSKVIIINKSNKYLGVYKDIINIIHCPLITVNKLILDDLNDIKYKIDEVKLISFENKMIREYAAVYSNREKCSYISKKGSLMFFNKYIFTKNEDIDAYKHLRTIILNYIASFDRPTHHLNSYIENNINNIKIDTYTKYYIDYIYDLEKKRNRLIAKLEMCCCMFNSWRSNDYDPVFLYLLIKSKLMRINYKTYTKVKDDITTILLK